MIIKYYDQEFLIYTELDLKNVFKRFLNFLINISMSILIPYQFTYNFILIYI